MTAKTIVLTHKVRCDECRWFGTEPLVAPHPFTTDEQLYGCPKCAGIELYSCCDEPDCGDKVACGTPTPGGYRSTCSKHAPTETRAARCYEDCSDYACARAGQCTGAG